MSDVRTMRLGAFLAVILAVGACSAHAREVRSPAVQQRPRWNATCMLVFGDSTVDPGNNNRLNTGSKANFPPYGKDFFDRRPTGRFCDGRLATDFIAEELGISRSIPAFLERNLTIEQLEHGVSFASASSGYDDFTATTANVLSFPEQIKYLKHYKAHLRSLLGLKKSEQIIRNAIVVVSAGTNDFIQNYYVYPNRSQQFTVPQYQHYLVSLISNYIQEIHGVGARRFVLAGIPPMGCLPIVKTFMGVDGCYSTYNDVAVSFNSKLVMLLSALKKKLSIRASFLDIYRVMTQAAKNPVKYGMVETAKGCCGSGTVECGVTCKDQSTCKDPSKYMFWDAVHPTERMYKIIADEAMKGVVIEVLG